MPEDSNANRPDVKRPRLFSAVEAAGLSLFALFTIIGITNMIWGGGGWAKAIAIGFATLTVFICMYIVLLSLRGVMTNRPVLILAAIFPGALILFEAGAILTVLLNGPHSPFGHVVDGISGPLTDGLLPGIYWPISFAAGAGLGAALIFWALRWYQEDNTPKR